MKLGSYLRLAILETITDMLSLETQRSVKRLFFQRPTWIHVLGFRNQSVMNSRHLAIPKKMRLLNSGKLNRSEVFFDTVTVSGGRILRRFVATLCEHEAHWRFDEHRTIDAF